LDKAKDLSTQGGEKTKPEEQGHDPCRGLQPCPTKQPFCKGWAGTDLDMGVTTPLQGVKRNRHINYQGNGYLSFSFQSSPWYEEHDKQNYYQPHTISPNNN
jgi:hypothetical protein